MTDGFLHKYFLNNPGNILHKWLHYFDIYEKHFERFRGKPCVMLEIGVMGGGSLDMWRAYFGQNSKIIGIDIKQECKQFESEGIEIHIGNQSDKNFINNIKQKYPHIDIVLDDGSHLSKDMIKTFALLYDHVQPRGVYMVEDTHTNYWSDWSGGPKAAGSFMEFTKDKLDEINAVHTKGKIPVSRFTASTSCISVYDSVVVFEKWPQSTRNDLVTMGLPPKA